MRQKKGAGQDEVEEDLIDAGSEFIDGMMDIAVLTLHRDGRLSIDSIADS